MSNVQLEENPWRMPPEAMVEKGLETVQTYLNDVKIAKDAGASTTSLQLLKVVLVGSPRAGKTRYNMFQSGSERLRDVVYRGRL